MKLFRYTFPTTIRSTRKRYHPCVIVSRDDDPREVASSRGSITRGTLRVTLEIITIKQRSACSTRE